MAMLGRTSQTKYLPRNIQSLSQTISLSKKIKQYERNIECLSTLSNMTLLAFVVLFLLNPKFEALGYATLLVHAISTSLQRTFVSLSLLLEMSVTPRCDSAGCNSLCAASVPAQNAHNKCVFASASSPTVALSPFDWGVFLHLMAVYVDEWGLLLKHFARCTDSVYKLLDAAFATTLRESLAFVL